MINLNKKQIWTCFHWQESRSGNVNANGILKKLVIRKNMKKNGSIIKMDYNYHEN